MLEMEGELGGFKVAHCECAWDIWVRTVGKSFWCFVREMGLDRSRQRES